MKTKEKFLKITILLISIFIISSVINIDLIKGDTTYLCKKQAVLAGGTCKCNDEYGEEFIQKNGNPKNEAECRSACSNYGYSFSSWSGTTSGYSCGGIGGNLNNDNYCYLSTKKPCDAENGWIEVSQNTVSYCYKCETSHGITYVWTENSLGSQCTLQSEITNENDCKGNEITSLHINGSSDVTIGNTLNLSYTYEPSNATYAQVNWSSSDTSIATVSSSGVVTGIKAGTVTITITAKDGSGVKSTKAIRVINSASTVSVTGVSVSPTNGKVEVGKTLQLSATVSPSNATNKNVTWTSSNTAVATVDSKGIVTGVKTGSTTITVKTADGNKTATANITVEVINYKIIYKPNGGLMIYNAEELNEFSTEFEGSKKISEAVSELLVNRDNFTFEGWYTEKINGNKISLDSTYQEIGNKTLYAHWKAEAGTKLTLSYDSNGGSVCQSKTIVSGEKVGSLCTPTKKGYKFEGWYNEKTGGNKVTSDSIIEDNITIYAKWTQSITNPKTGIETPVIAILLMLLISGISFIFVKKKSASIN